MPLENNPIDAILTRTVVVLEIATLLMDTTEVLTVMIIQSFIR